MSKSTALIRKPDMELMPPPPPAKRIKRPPKVLDEDAYTDALSDIIARDFFPGLLETKCQQELLDAIEMGDDDRIVRAQRKLADIRTPGGPRRMATPRQATPRRGDVGNVDREGLEGDDKPKEEAIPAGMSLDRFQATYTSEDNASFNTLLDRQNEKKREQHPWLWNGNKRPSKQQIAQAKVLEGKTLAGLIEDGSSKKSIVPEDTRKAIPETWKSDPLNHFMFMPEGVDQPKPPPLSAKLANLPPKSIKHENTRLADPLSETTVPASPSLSAIHDAISGNPRGSTVGGGGETPRVRGYGFVSTPSPADLLRTRESTPMAPSIREGTPGHNPFKLTGMSKREELHLRIVDKSMRSKRATSQARTPMQVGGGATPRAMTPAAARLLTSMSKGRSGSGFGGDIFERKNTEVDPKGRWVPTPKMSGGATPLMRKK